MVDLQTHYLGIKLKNPIIVGACNLSTDTGNLQKMEAAGAAAVVYKSLFEEQIQLEDLQMEMDMQDYNDRNAEMISLFPDISHAGPREYLHNLKQAVAAVDIPVFASINAVDSGSWVEYAKEVAETGVAGLELNLFQGAAGPDKDEAAIIDEQIRIIRDIKATIQIPVSVKISPYYTNTEKVIHEMDRAGADGFVLFNRMFEPDIDVDSEKHHFPYNLSNPEDKRLALRYAGLLHTEIGSSICTSGGIFSGKDIVALILAGADAVQVVSALYKFKISHIRNMLLEMEDWMESKGYTSIDDFRGKLSRFNSNDPYAYKRAQYIDILMKSSEIFRKYPMI
ncbi:MAG TPA: dihydroorotate dehydrogenase-like protein [Bacteroidales bacterium]|nr:dihydroorotate dehydrogenase-like protein [Lentimicrobiaceae bacterium]HOI00031.1 dihydroorotate dehydrogenase-like protein [Bacteroidales bacterium]